MDEAAEPVARCSHRHLHDPEALALEDLIEGAAVFVVAVADQEAGTPILKSRARLRACWVTQAPVGFAACEPDAPARVLDEEEDVLAAQKHALDREEVAGDNTRCLLGGLIHEYDHAA